jgi:hypothetical protein
MTANTVFIAGPYTPAINHPVNPPSLLPVRVASRMGNCLRDMREPLIQLHG